jgi:hypothetical protein
VTGVVNTSGFDEGCVFMSFHCIVHIPAKGAYTVVTLPRNVTPYRDSVDGTGDHVKGKWLDKGTDQPITGHEVPE